MWAAIAAALAFLTLESGRRAPPTMKFGRFWKSPDDRWTATELLSPAAIAEIAGLLDIGLSHLVAGAVAGTTRIVLLADGWDGNHAVVVLGRDLGGWRVTETWRKGGDAIQSEQASVISPMLTALPSPRQAIPASVRTTPALLSPPTSDEGAWALPVDEPGSPVRPSLQVR